MENNYDLIIIGMGPGGISAAIYAKRSNIKVLCLDGGSPGGILNYVDKIDNYPGIPSISGASLSYKLIEHINSLEIPYKTQMVTEIVKEKDGFIVKTKKEEYFAKKIIIAAGRKAKKLGLENEKKFLGRGVSNCAVCDGPFYKNKKVVVVGGGQSAIQEALYLATTVDKLYLIHRKNKFSASMIDVDRLRSYKNVEIIYNDEVVSINGDKFLESIDLKSGRRIETDGLFVYIGYDPNGEFLESLDILENNGYVNVNDKFETKIHGIFAIGDIIKKDYYQIIMAMSDGAVAALNAVKEINHEK